MKVGCLILEELAEREQTLFDLRDAIGATDAQMCEYMDESRSILPVAELFARFFGTSVSLWRKIGSRVVERSENGRNGVHVGIGRDGLGGVLATVRSYRAVQDEEHGGPSHDDTHNADDWKRFIDKFNHRARFAVRAEDRERDLFHVAALAVAAIQSSRRIRVGKCSACGMPDTVVREDGITRYCVHCGGTRLNDKPL